jgi:hypothetical protein
MRPAAHCPPVELASSHVDTTLELAGKQSATVDLPAACTPTTSQTPSATSTSLANGRRGACPNTPGTVGWFEEPPLSGIMNGRQPRGSCSR